MLFFNAIPKIVLNANSMFVSATIALIFEIFSANVEPLSFTNSGLLEKVMNKSLKSPLFLSAK
ncbi:hypothetical protein SDC9_209205 [bioreactor metagenome]|uniref:Uncharacterized protein n=1 Tax=bioreactor metagenome TaxID=1076179 RepID=A0A645JCQ2_9ZZZZ